MVGGIKAGGWRSVRLRDNSEHRSGAGDVMKGPTCAGGLKRASSCHHGRKGDGESGAMSTMEAECGPFSRGG